MHQDFFFDVVDHIDYKNIWRYSKVQNDTNLVEINATDEVELHQQDEAHIRELVVNWK